MQASSGISDGSTHDIWPALSNVPLRNWRPFSGLPWAIFITYLALIPYQLMLLWILGRFLIIVRTITRDVLYAAVALYLLIGAVFVPIYGLLGLLIPGSFIDGSYSNAPVQWQQLIYFSYTSLTYRLRRYFACLMVGAFAR